MATGVEARIDGPVGRITLQRPDALHALNTPMCAAIHAALSDWAGNPAVSLVWIGHEAGTRGFCAGGDIRMLAESGAGDASEARAFFRTEYRMNAALKAFPKPVMAIIDGITMGGGVGLSVHGSHRVATERTLFAMPETGIGLFPDVGGGWFLPRLSGEIGTWLALTGARLKGGDAVSARIATHYIPSELVPALEKQVWRADYSAGAADMLNEILRGLAQNVPEPAYAPHLEVIRSAFSHDRAETILSSLVSLDTEWSREQAALLRSRSPETIKLALRQLRRGAQMKSFEDNMRMEYRIGWRKVQSHDFLEGVRAVIIDKDNAPAWKPARLEDVSDEDVEGYFAPLGADELNFDP